MFVARWRGWYVRRITFRLILPLKKWLIDWGWKSKDAFIITIIRYALVQKFPNFFVWQTACQFFYFAWTLCFSNIVYLQNSSTANVLSTASCHNVSEKLYIKKNKFNILFVVKFLSTLRVIHMSILRKYVCMYLYRY